MSWTTKTNYLLNFVIHCKLAAGTLHDSTAQPQHPLPPLYFPLQTFSILLAPIQISLGGKYWFPTVLVVSEGSAFWNRIHIHLWKMLLESWVNIGEQLCAKARIPTAECFWIKKWVHISGKPTGSHHSDHRGRKLISKWYQGTTNYALLSNFCVVKWWSITLMSHNLNENNSSLFPRRPFANKIYGHSFSG